MRSLAARPPPHTSDDAGQVATALTELIAARAGEEPLAIVLDDIQWVDRASAGALAFAIRASAHLPVFVLTSFRSTHSLPFDPDRLLAADKYQELRLEGLAPAGVHHLLVDRCGVALGSRRPHQSPRGLLVRRSM